MAIKRVPITEKIREQTTDSPTATNSPMEGRTIMGIDPGTNILGYAVITIKDNNPIPIVMGTVNLGKYGDPYKKLAQIFDRLSSLITQYHPNEMALEAPFYANNVQSMLKLGRAQGVAMAAALSRGIDVFEYLPTRVKQAVAGQGRASKEQIAGILHHILAIELGTEKLDATDALAVALCHFFTQCAPPSAKLPKTKSKNGGWNTFISANPAKITK